MTSSLAQKEVPTVNDVGMDLGPLKRQPDAGPRLDVDDTTGLVGFELHHEEDVVGNSRNWWPPLYLRYG